jgi:hypothetical protein
VFIALAIATVLLAVMVTGSAAKKLQKDPQVLDVIGGTVERYLPLLAAVELPGAAGILVGLRLAPLGIAAAAGLVLCFLGAMIGHLRVGDTKGLVMPLVPLVLSVAVLVLRVATA